ncbi:spindle and kinetochore-associated protein 3-like [Mesoplodon densirostris]|uniref:spindle and kinetochore-associated protein 3-like n=1 Tax=Mesoplodon densirostris TaxID=48708 RepID=UPI0028DC3D52|nr:spindle and kinetochore-associated protein 3-like [Mesoplodon densirostris]
MDLIRGFCGKLRSLAVTLDGETARLQRALDGEDSDFEDYPMRVLHDLHSEVRTLKDDVNILLDEASLESQESIGFIKATKVLMKKNSMDIMKIREFFQKYGYNPRAKENSGVNNLHFIVFVLVLKKEGSMIKTTIVLAIVSSSDSAIM